AAHGTRRLAALLQLASPPHERRWSTADYSGPARGQAREASQLAGRRQLHPAEPCGAPPGPSHRSHDALRVAPVAPIHALGANRQPPIRAGHEDAFGETTGLERLVDALGDFCLPRAADGVPQWLEGSNEIASHTAREIEERIDPAHHDEAIPQCA